MKILWPSTHLPNKSNLEQTNCRGHQLYVMPVFYQIRKQRKGHDSSSPRKSHTNTGKCSVLSGKDLEQTGKGRYLQALEANEYKSSETIGRAVKAPYRRASFL